ncbi:MAG: hypothetical protein JW982_16725 [Spirochaetes bacterium]|nr:hypothetical protein [Spirochaetota bacterium]
MRKYFCLILIILITGSICSQELNFDVNKLKFYNLTFHTTEKEIVNTFGKPEINYLLDGCDYYAGRDADGNPYRQLKYKNISFIGSPKENYILQSVLFDRNGKIFIKYDDIILNGKMTRTEFIKLFKRYLGDYTLENLDTEFKEMIPIYMKSDDGLYFRFKDDKLVKIEYWSPC